MRRAVVFLIMQPLARMLDPTALSLKVYAHNGTNDAALVTALLLSLSK
jgi:hypothetical protein